MEKTEIFLDKLAAYRITDYCVDGELEAFTLRIGIKSDSLLRLYKETGVNCGMFITAFNPFGHEQSGEANETEHARLGDELGALCHIVVEGAGDAPSGDWPVEKSFFALGIDSPVARRLGIKYHQDAIVWTGSDAIPQLLLLR